MSNMQMQRSVTTSDGITRTVDGKQFGTEYRIYRVYGDVTDSEALAEMCQIISCELGVSKVTMSL